MSIHYDEIGSLDRVTRLMGPQFDPALTWYLAGPMTGVPRFNIPTFDRVARILRRQRVHVVSPVELDDTQVRSACAASLDGTPTSATDGGGTWGELLARDVKVISDQVDGIIFLPDWHRSRGARLEAFVGLLTGKKFAWWDDMTEFALTVHADTVRRILTENMP